MTASRFAWSRCIALLGACSATGGARAQVVDADLRTSVFHEPSSTSALTVVNPSVALTARPAGFLGIRAAYEADIVSGASEAVKGGRLAAVDIVSAATTFSDTRHVASGGLTITRESTELGLSYSYGTESDYRSHSFGVDAATTFLQKNTELRLSYARGFDEVCTTDFRAADDPSTRSRLDSSEGCFTDAPDRASRELDLDNLQVAWTQSWTPVFTTQAVLSGALQHGFLGNPYRAVVIAPAGDEALEYHPDNRARGAVSLRGKLYLRSIAVAFSAGVRVYRDTWDLVSQAYELGAERYILPGLRAELRARYYRQSAALFYSDDYTGGEPLDGPRGRYWTGDRELSPMASWFGGARLVYGVRRPPQQRLLGALLTLSGTAGVDLLYTDLERFTWGGTDPDDTVGILGSLGVSAGF